MSFSAWPDSLHCWTTSSKPAAYFALFVFDIPCPLVIIRQRASDDALKLVEHILAPLQSRFVYLSYEDHDIVTANTQAVTHAAFLR